MDETHLKMKIQALEEVVKAYKKYAKTLEEKLEFLEKELKIYEYIKN